MSERICPECGGDTWKAASYDDLNDARNRHHRKNKEQAIRILELELRVAELEGRHSRHQKKILRQSRVIRRLENRLREAGLFPHEGVKPAEAEPVEQSLQPERRDEDLSYGFPSVRGLRVMKRRREEKE